MARAYLDQLVRGHGISDERWAAVDEILGRAEAEPTAGSLAADLEQLAGELEADAEEAFALNQRRLRLLAATLTGIAALDLG